MSVEYASLLVIVPTRRRPQNVVDLIEAFAETRTVAQLLVWIDGDPDDDLYLYGAEVPAWCQVVRSSYRRRLCGTLNYVASTYAAVADVLGFMGDDHRPRTHGWDQAVLDAMQPLGVVYADDGFQGPSLPTSVFLDAKIVRRTGRFVHPDVEHLYCDDGWKALGSALRTLTYLPDVLIEHMHPAAGKAESDQGYAEVNSAQRYEADGEAYRRWLARDLPRLVADLKGAA